jgi:hypothetical protein
LDHTWWRKYENLSGRWTSHDPLSGGIGDPQSFNGYNYTGNDPVNFIDPSGLDPQDPTRPPNTPTIDPATGQPYPGGVPGVSAGVMVRISWDDPTPSDGGARDWGGFLPLAVIPQKLKDASPGQQSRFDDAYKEFLRRLLANNGENSCARFFGGLQNALKTLGKTSFKAKSLEGLAAHSNGKTIRIDPAKAFMDTSGSVPITVGYTSNRSTRSFDPLTITLGNVEAAAFILAHEFAHRSNVNGFNPDDATTTSIDGTVMGLAGAHNNQMIWQACFGEYSTR